jgi:hypothetical protein
MEKQDMENSTCPVCGRSMRAKMAKKQSNVEPYLGKQSSNLSAHNVGTLRGATRWQALPIVLFDKQRRTHRCAFAVDRLRYLVSA